jgi:HSP20 family protein
MLDNLLPRLRRTSEEIERPASIFDLMDEMMRQSKGNPPSFAGSRQFPSVDVKEEDGEIEVSAEVPGMNPEDIEVSIDGDTLTIRGEKRFEEEEKKDKYTRVERSYGSFYRSFRLPTSIDQDKVTAKYDKGVLKLMLPKSEAATARKIAIES